MLGSARSDASPPALPPHESRPDAQAARRFWPILAVLCVIALPLRLALLDEFLRNNPLSQRPCADGAVYWQMAGRMAAGQWLDAQPFISAPLYPCFLGVIRTLGGGLLAVYITQLFLHLATAIVIAWVTRLRFGWVAGLLSAALFLALTEPAVTSTRILANTVQILLFALLWWRWAVLADHGQHWRDLLAVGALLGLTALASPAAILLVPLFVAWGWWTWGHSRFAISRALAGGAIALIVIAPATLHNYRACGQFIPITAHGGITLRQGNGPGACGVYAQVPGVSVAREQMHEDVARQFRETYGRAGTPTEIDAHYRREAFQYWLNNPGATFKLIAMKAYLFFTAQNYDDMMPTTLERQYGLASRAVLAPLPLPWVLGAAFVGIVAVLRHPLQRFPEYALALLPLLVVLIFFYGPRYRIVGAPLYCGLAAFALTHYPKFRCSPAVTIAVIALPPLLTIFAASAIDSPDRIRADWMRAMSGEYMAAGDRRLAVRQLDDAERWYTGALALSEHSVYAHRQLGVVYLERGRTAAGQRELERALALNPNDRPSLVCLYAYYCKQEDYRAAGSTLRRMLTASPADTEAHLALAWLQATCPDARVRDGAAAVENALAGRRASGRLADALDVLAAAYAEARQFDDATRTAASALEIVRTEGNPDRAGEISRRLDLYRQGEPCRAAPRGLSAQAPQ